MSLINLTLEDNHDDCHYRLAITPTFVYQRTRVLELLDWGRGANVTAGT